MIIDGNFIGLDRTTTFVGTIAAYVGEKVADKGALILVAWQSSQEVI